MKYILVALLAVGQVAHANTQDPWEATNRKVFAFNEALDNAILKPVAKGYRSVVPKIGRTAISNVFSNLSEIPTFLNALLQAKPEKAANALGRFVFNSTIGLGGTMDVMSSFGLEQQPEDFGQSLAHWGVESGPYVVLPLLGPSTVRDGAARLTVDQATDPVVQLNPQSHRNAVTGLNLVQTREGFLDAERFLYGDRYTALRNAYLSNREFQINDGYTHDADDFLNGD